MPPPWREPGDTGNLRVTAQMLAFYRRVASDSPPPGVRRYRCVEEASAERGDPYRGNPAKQ